MREENFACLESRSKLVGAQIEGQGLKSLLKIRGKPMQVGTAAAKSL